MELRAAIAALELLSEPCEVELHSDSKYLIDAISKKWIEGWKKRGWQTADKKPVKNQDLWLQLLAAIGGHKIDWRWVKGHAGHEENERCDELGNIAVGREFAGGRGIRSGARIDKHENCITGTGGFPSRSGGSQITLEGKAGCLRRPADSGVLTGSCA